MTVFKTHNILKINFTNYLINFFCSLLFNSKIKNNYFKKYSITEMPRKSACLEV